MQAANFDKPIFGKYELRGKLKVGGFGSVYRAKPIQKKDVSQYAIKILPNKHEKYAQMEFALYQAIAEAQFTKGFVKHYEYGKVDGKICLVMELVGQDLDDIMAKTKSNRFSLKTGLMIGLQAIDRIEALHKIGYLHRDIKPDNFTIGLNEKNSIIYLIDFGLSKKIHSPLPKQEKGKIVGTLAYMSCNVHEGKQPGILDDIESFIYTIMYLIHGNLPWMGIQVQQPADYHRIKIMKQKLSRSWFIKNGISQQLFDILQLCKSPKRNPKFDYLQIKYKLMNALTSISAENDFNFDWCKGQEKNTKRDTSRKLIEDNVNVKKMNEDNQKIVQNQIYEIYKFMDEQEKQKRKEQKRLSPKKIKQHPQIKKAQIEKKKQMRAKEEMKAKQYETAPKQRRPMSSNNPRPGTGQKNQLQNQLQKQYKLIQSMKFEGPRIVINRTAAHKI